ncbi:MAG: response regulator [Elusimicrobiota bacterium]|nr:response regulator [Elusimicrobiota bacterium]
MAREKILIIDDEQDLVKLVKEILELEKFQVSCAHDGEEGLRKAASEIPDLILLDIKMPGVNGFQVLERLKIDETTAHIPVVMLTTSTLRKDRDKAFDLGAVDYVIKSLEGFELGERIHKMLKERFRK